MEEATPADETALMKRWVDTWKFVTGPELARIKKEDLRALTEEEGLQRVHRVMNSRIRHARAAAKKRTPSGLIEQQRIFLKAQCIADE